MSNPVRISLIAEGITDYVVLKAAIEVILQARPFDLKLLQPDASVAFTRQGAAGTLGGGWPGVLKWMMASVNRAGRLSSDPLFLNTDLLILHLDADVASLTPALNNDRSINGLVSDLPCEQDCPPPSDTTNRLRAVMLKWVGEDATPSKTVFCTPSKSTEAWVVTLFFLTDKELIKKGFECHPNPAKRLSVQPIANRFDKSEKDYTARHQNFKVGWNWLTTNLSEAKRFQDEFAAAAGAIP
jgi:hypothetical protein